MATDPQLRALPDGDVLLLAVAGAWISRKARRIEEIAAGIRTQVKGYRRVEFDLAGVERLDTLGAFVLDRAARELNAGGVEASIRPGIDEHRILIEEVHTRSHRKARAPRPGGGLWGWLDEVGRAVVGVGNDFRDGVGFLGAVVASLTMVLTHPARLRFTAIVVQMEKVGFRGVPIIALISFLVGAIVAQQTIYQLQRFGAVMYVVDLLGIFALRELGVLLTAIMISGRSGSAFTAELGSMRMREEVDALRVMGLSPVEVLVLPRLLALMVAMPCLAFIAGMCALTGGALVAWVYGGIPPDMFLSRLAYAIGVNTFMVGIIKAPFMGLIIGLIACLEGMKVEGSAESLGHHVTAAVVKAIFMVIVADGLFAVFFASIGY